MAWASQKHRQKEEKDNAETEGKEKKEQRSYGYKTSVCIPSRNNEINDTGLEFIKRDNKTIFSRFKFMKHYAFAVEL